MPTDGVPGPWLTIDPLPVTRFTGRCPRRQGTEERKGSDPIAMPSGRNPVGQGELRGEDGRARGRATDLAGAGRAGRCRSRHGDQNRGRCGRQRDSRGRIPWIGDVESSRALFLPSPHPIELFLGQWLPLVSTVEPRERIGRARREVEKPAASLGG